MDEWVDIKDDIPCIKKGMKRVSVDINVLLVDGTVIEDCFCTTDDEQFFDSNGKRIPKRKVKGWKSR